MPEFVGHLMRKPEPLRVGKLDQWILDALLATPRDGVLNRVRFRALSSIRRARLRIADPAVHFRLGQFGLLLPLSHDLPLYRRALPQYASNLGRAVNIVQAKYRDLTMIDVGANIGDSVAIVRAHANVPILCVEGEDRFFQLLELNTRELVDIELEHAFLAGVQAQVSAVHVSAGTAHMELGANTGRFTTQTLREAISYHPRFARSKFLKLDAEGFDCKIISCESQFLSLIKPILFFEYHPPLCSVAGYDPFPVFQLLSKLDYSAAIIYENTGNYLLRADLGQRKVLEHIHHHLTNIGGFCDVVAFHNDDLDVAEALQKVELDHATKRSIKLPGLDMEDFAHVD